MSYRILVNVDTYAAVECDTVDELLSLLDVVDHLPVVKDSPKQEELSYYSNSLYYWIMATDKQHGGDSVTAQTIRELWDNESWDSIMDKLRTEGSTWIVWWMDGVRKYAEHDQKQRDSAV